MNELLREFLTSKNLLERFNELVCEHFKGTNYNGSFLGIGGAFVWENTIEGHDFWKDLEDEFYLFLEGKQ